MLGNYFFLAVTAPVLTVVGTWVTHRFVEPRLGPWQPREEHKLADLAPELEHPVLYQTIRELLEALADEHEVCLSDLPARWFE